MSGELRGLEPEEKLEWIEVVLIEERGCMGKLGTARGVDGISGVESVPGAGGNEEGKGVTVLPLVVEGVLEVAGGSSDCCP